jgi:hypothetical protein
MEHQNFSYEPYVMWDILFTGDRFQELIPVLCKYAALHIPLTMNVSPRLETEASWGA